MKQKIKNVTTLLAGIFAAGAIYAGTSALVSQYQKVERLEQEASCSLKEAAQERQNNYRKNLIKHGNPEGWKECSDDTFGKHYTRLNGDGMGGYWTEYLK